MDSKEDYSVAKSIVQSGQSDEEWDSLRQGKGNWPMEKKTWKQFRAYSLQELKDEMKAYNQTKSAGIGYLPSPPVYSFEVDDIPDVLLAVFASKGSVHASSILNGSQEEREIVASWIKRNLVAPDFFELDHDHSVPLNSTKYLKDYVASFEARGYSVWNVENDAEMTCRVKFVQRNDKSRVCDLSGCPDFIITPSKRKSDGVVTTKADRKFCTVCVIEVQSKHGENDISLCEVQLQLYLMLVMNMGDLKAVVGFLVQDDGMCRTYKATRKPTAIMYEQNDLVHVSHIAEVLHVLWESGMGMDM